MHQPKVKVIRLEKDLVRAIRLINKLLTLNDLHFKYSLNLDYKSKNYGEFDPQKANDIYLNPAAFYNTSKEDPHALYFSTDYSIYAVSIHEFSHLLDAKFNILDKYKIEFSDKLILNQNSESSRSEELAEVMSLYILNPYLLKLIDKSRYIFLRDIFISPTVCRKSNFISKWTNWPDKIKDLCAERWKICVSGDKILFLN